MPNRYLWEPLPWLTTNNVTGVLTCSKLTAEDTVQSTISPAIPYLWKRTSTLKVPGNYSGPSNLRPLHITIPVIQQHNCYSKLNILGFDAIRRKYYNFMQRLHNSGNEIINVLCLHLMCLIICSDVTF